MFNTLLAGLLLLVLIFCVNWVFNKIFGAHRTVREAASDDLVMDADYQWHRVPKDEE